MAVTRELKQGDPCPGCGGQLEKAQQPTPAERAAAAHREDPRPLPPHYDTASQEVVDELGPLYRCPRCGYPHRFGPETSADGDGSADAGGKKRKS